MADKKDDKQEPGLESDAEFGLAASEDDRESGLSIDESEDSVDDSDGFLDVDDHQSEEIRGIFGTALPQYLQPVEELIEQILSGKGDSESILALDGMLSSLENASSRMGFEKIHDLLEGIHTRVSGLDRDSLETVPGEVREAVLGDLLEIKDLAAELGEASPLEAGEQQESIFNALQGKEGIGDLVLRRLGAAGLVSVDQLLQARPDEIAAVSGLDIEIVERILSTLRGKDAPEAARPARETPRQVESLHEQVLQKLRSEVETEAYIEDLKAEVRKLRARVSERRAALRALDDMQKETKKALRALSKSTARREDYLEELQLRREELLRKCAISEEALRREEVRIEALNRERKSLEEQANNLSQSVDGLVDTLGRIRRLVAKGRLTE